MPAPLSTGIANRKGDNVHRHSISPTVQPSDLSRRRFLASTALLGGAAWFASHDLIAQDAGVVAMIRADAAKADIQVRRLRGNVSALMGSGGNVAVLTGAEGKLLIDAGIAVSRVRMAAALDTLSPDPIRHLVNTHWHFDHTDGNAWLHDAGASIVAHENTRKHLSVATRVEDWHTTFPAAPAGALPTTVFATHHAMHLNGESIVLQRYEPAHTDADIYVRFADADVLHVGDTWWNGLYPFIDYSTGGSIDGTIRAAEANVAAVSGTTLVVPGHGPIGGRAELIAFRDMLIAIRERVAALKRQGLSLKEVVAARPTASFDAKWGDFPMDGKAFAALVFAGV
jgi:glyoxylase-like metal-dependent hydrolase (beta-lactamase superfamily II)